jgi:hypothetical protein
MESNPLKLNNYEVFTRQTTVSWRILVAISSTLIVIKYFDYDADAWLVFGRVVEPEDFGIISTVTVSFLLLSYLINWYGDYVSLTKWFKINQITKNSIDSIGAVKNMESPIQGVERRLKNLKESNENATERLLDLEAISLDELQSIQDGRNVASDLENMRSTISKNSEVLNHIAIQIIDLKSLLLDLNVNFETVSRVSAFLMYGWYLAFPVLLALVAIFLR